MMEPFAFLLLVGLIVVYFVFYRPAFVLKPEKDRKKLLDKFEETAILNRQLLSDLRQYTQHYNLWERPFDKEDTFRVKIAELESACEELFGEENYHGLKSLNPKKLDMELMNATLDDQLKWHGQVRNALTQHMASLVAK